MTDNTHTASQGKKITVSDLTDFVQQVFMRCDVPAPDARVAAECLVFANSSGVESHGVVRLPHYVTRLGNGTIKSKPTMSLRQTAPSTALLDGGDGLGHVITRRACDEAVRLARESGTGVVAVYNSSHFGMAGYYVEQIVRQGCAAMVMTHTDLIMAPYGARKPYWGTNPLAIGFPTDGITLMLDMATSHVAYGKLVVAKTEGHSIPPDWGMDADGRPTTDPSMVTSLLPAAGAKGSGLAMVIDVFCSLLTGMAFGPHINRMYQELDQPRGLGHLVLALDIERFVPLAEFKQRLRDMMDEVHALEPAEGFDRVLCPGEVEGLKRQKRAAEGVPLDPGLLRELEQLAGRFGVALKAV